MMNNIQRMTRQRRLQHWRSACAFRFCRIFFINGNLHWRSSFL